MKILNFNAINFTIRKVKRGTSTRSSVVKTPPCNAGDLFLSPGWGNKISHAAWHNQKSLVFYFKLCLVKGKINL